MLSLAASLALAGTPQVIAHRGGMGWAPENTLSAFEKSAGMGVGFELDVTLSSDGHVIVLHDDSVDRTSDGQGAASELTLEQLKALDMGAWFGPEFAGERIPTLGEVLDTFGGEVLVDIEIKTHPDRAALAGGVVAEIQRLGLQELVIVTSFDPFMLEQVKDLDPSIPRGQLTGTFDDAELNPVSKLILKRMWLNGKSEPQVVVVEASRLSERYIRKQQNKGVEVWAWVVNDPEEIRRLLDWGVTGIITDYPGVALEQL